MHSTSIERTDQYTHPGLVFTILVILNVTSILKNVFVKHQSELLKLNRVRLKLQRGTLCSLYKVW